MRSLKAVWVYGLVALLAVAMFPAGGSRAAERVKVSLIQSFHAMSFAAVYVARARNFFEQEGVDLDFQMVRGDAVAAQGLVGRAAPMAALGGTTAVLLASKGIREFISVSPVIGAVAASIAVRKDVAEARGLHRGLPLEQRISLLKGMRISTGSLGGTLHTAVSYLMRRGGLDPNSDVTLLSMGGPAEMLAALKAKNIDAIAMGAPAPEMAEREGSGVIVISMLRGDVPELANMPYDVLLVRRDYAEANPDAVRRVVRALGRAMAFMRENPDGTRDALLGYFDKVPPAVVSEVARHLSSAVPADGRFTEEMWKNQMTFDVKAGKLPKALDTREGVLWTNEFIARR